MMALSLVRNYCIIQVGFIFLYLFVDVNIYQTFCKPLCILVVHKYDGFKMSVVFSKLHTIECFGSFLHYSMPY